MTDWLMLPRVAGEAIRLGGRAGRLSVAEDGDGLAAVVAVSTGTAPFVPSGLSIRHSLFRSAGKKQGYWHRAHPELHEMWQQTAARGGELKKKALDDRVDQSLAHPGSGLFYLVTFAPLTLSEGGDGSGAGPAARPEFVAWLVSGDAARPVTLDLEPELLGPARLEPQWSADDLSSTHVVLVGAGSIGSAAARELAQFGVGRLSLVDPDRLAWHNLVRHTLPSRHVGRYKTEALAEELRDRWPDLQVESYAFDIAANTDLFRPLVDDADLVLCAADGVAARRVVSNTARIARTDAVLACVLMDGELGEVLRLRSASRRLPAVPPCCPGCQWGRRRRSRPGPWLRHRLPAPADDSRRQRPAPCCRAGSQGQRRNASRGARSRQPPARRRARRPAASRRAGAPSTLPRRTHRGHRLVTCRLAAVGLSHLRRGVTAPGGPRAVVLSPASAASIRVEAATSADGFETGGLLLGHVHDECVEVRYAGGPGPNARRKSDRFSRDLEHSTAMAQAAWQLDRSVWVGEWHTHPKGGPPPSQLDLATYARHLRDPDLSLPCFTALIVLPGAWCGWNGVAAYGWSCSTTACHAVPLSVRSDPAAPRPMETQ